MNEKTARLIRKFAQQTRSDERDLKRRWTEMSQDERSAFRQQMTDRVRGGSDAAADAPASEDA